MTTAINLTPSLTDAETMVIRAVGKRLSCKPATLTEAWEAITQHLSPNGDSAKLCLNDAKWCQENKMPWHALNRTVDALSYLGGTGWIDVNNKLRSMRIQNQTPA